MGSMTALKCPIVVGSSILVGGLEEIMVSLCGVWGALCLHTAPTDISTHKGVNLGYIIVSACLGYFYTQAPLLMSFTL
jgi:hypothetical protein